jgi:hypothetical protein
MNKIQIKKPVFIIGCGRSGTGLLFDLLGQHPSLVKTMGYPDGEDHLGWVEHGNCVMAGIGNHTAPQFGTGINGFQVCLPMSENDVTDKTISRMHQYYFDSVLNGDTSLRVINKQPHLSNKLHYLLKIFPDAKIIHIIRDCPAVVASWKAIMNAINSVLLYIPPDEENPCFWLMPRPEDKTARELLDKHPHIYPGGDGAVFIDYWCKVNKAIPNEMKACPSQLLTIRYEDLIENPNEMLKKIDDFCELAPYEYAVKDVQRNTANKHKALVDEVLAEKIHVNAMAVRKMYGYLSSEVKMPYSLYIPESNRHQQ